MAVKILAAWMLADFYSGVGHWAEDRLLMAPHPWAVLEGIRLDNVKHHKRPGAVTLQTLWGNINTTVPYVWPMALGAWWLGAPLVLWLSLWFVGFGNYVHRLAHEVQVGRVVSFLQWTELFIPFENHHFHHFCQYSGKVIAKEDAKDNYCVMTGWLNPILDMCRFWRGLEWLLRVK